jgi:hypothetical protein
MAVRGLGKARLLEIGGTSKKGIEGIEGIGGTSKKGIGGTIGGISKKRR